MTVQIKVAVYGPNIGHGGEFDVHKPGCSDTWRDPRRRGYADEIPMVFEASSQQEVVEAVYADQLEEARAGESSATEWTAYEGEFRFYPCCGLTQREEVK
jgi:hypothetical protein